MKVICRMLGRHRWTFSWIWGQRCSRCGVPRGRSFERMADTLADHPDHPDFQEQWR